MRQADTGVLSCSFCRKSQDSVAKLISNPGDYPRAYICNECIAVCLPLSKTIMTCQPVFRGHLGLTRRRIRFSRTDSRRHC